MKLPWGLLLFNAYLPAQKNPRRTRIGNLPVDVQIIQRAGVRVTDMFIEPAFVQFTEVGFREDGAALGLIHGDAEQIFYIMHRHDYRRTGRVKGTEQISCSCGSQRADSHRTRCRWCCASHGPVVRRNLQRCKLVEVKQETDKISLQSQIVRSVTTRHSFYKILPVCGKVFISGTGVSVRSSYMARYPSEDFCQPPSCHTNTTSALFICMTLNVMLSATR